MTGADHELEQPSLRSRRGWLISARTGFGLAMLSLFATGLLGCGSSETPAPGPASIRFSMDTDVGAAVEIEKCRYVSMPTDRGEMAINSAVSHYTPGSHHFLVYRTSLTAIPSGSEVVHDCVSASVFSVVRGTYYEAQAPESKRELPPKIAHVFAPGEILILQSHYVNTTPSTLHSHVEFELRPIDRDTISAEAGTIFFYNPSIEIPPRTTRTVTRTCPLAEDIHLALLWSHMHERGVGFEATTDDPTAAQALGPLYATDDWSAPVPRAFGNDALLPGGSHITYACRFYNQTDDTIVQGLSARTNEMCILHGMYWPRQPPVTELCLGGISSSQ